ncbi:MAG: metallophosphoesterase family protein [Spirochaetota bacterium]|nr:metallophosphoesterase family protein [Spirochaetota bacterium]
MFFNTKSKWNDGPYLILKNSPETSITICWITGKKKDSFLIWGNSETNLNNTEASSGKKNHSVTINNLIPDTQYFYTIRENLTLYSEDTVFSFCTAKGADSKNKIDFIIAGDLQPKNEYTLKTNKILARQIDKDHPDFIVQLGDLVQFGSLVKYWHYLMRILPLMASTRPVLPVIGNHEYYFFHRNKNFKSFFPFNYPGKKSSYYSKDIGHLHITFLDPYDGGFAGMGSRTTDRQKEWFDKDLNSAVGNGASWIFVVLHQAVLSNGEYSGDVKLQKWILPILSKYNVDAVFWGHAHLYEHWQYQYGKNGYLLNKDDKPGDNPIDFFCIGSSGASLESNFRLFSHKPFVHKRPEWFHLESREVEKKFTIQYPWNRDISFKGRMGVDQFTNGDRHYYHFPFDGQGNYSEDSRYSYNTENKWFGYLYGENTLHYAKVKVARDTCTISIHYADGSLLKGPNGSLPQRFSYKRKKSRTAMRCYPVPVIS